MLETLYTLQNVLFPEQDLKSRRLCSRLGFDEDCLRFEAEGIVNSEEKEIVYTFWLERLEDLADEMRPETKRPRGRLGEWLHGKSNPRYTLLATLISVLIAILIGLAALAVAIVQTWISYMAWKHPVAQVS